MAETKKKTVKKKTVKKSTTKKVEEKVEEKKDSVEDKKAKLEALKKKAESLAGKVDSGEKIDLKKEVKKSKKKDSSEQEEIKEGLVPIEDYLKSSIHLGTRVITPDMKPYVYKRRADGLAVFNTSTLDEKLKEGAEYLAQFAPEDIVLICKREAGWKALEMFSKVLGVKIFTKKYPAGILTNPQLDNFLEAELVFICDPWLDKNALTDANNIKIPVLSICDTNNYTMGIDKIIPGNNKSAKSLGMILYLLAKQYVEKRKLDIEIPPVSEWIENWDNLVPPK